MQTNYNSSISFNARLGAKLKATLLKNDFAGDIMRLEKFEKLFHDTFEKNIDTNTVVNVTTKGRFKLSNLIAPKIAYPVRLYSAKGKPLSQRILNECSKVYANTEYRLFQKIISTRVHEGKPIEQIAKLGEKLDAHRRPYFMDLIGTASRILKENPNSKLSEYDFSDMINIQLREIIETPEFQQAMAKGDFAEGTKILKR